MEVSYKLENCKCGCGKYKCSNETLINHLVESSIYSRFCLFIFQKEKKHDRQQLPLVVLAGE